jgi:hypothetical protein
MGGHVIMTKRYQPIEANIDRETANTLIRRIAELSLAMDKMNIAEMHTYRARSRTLSGSISLRLASRVPSIVHTTNAIAREKPYERIGTLPS